MPKLPPGQHSSDQEATESIVTPYCLHASLGSAIRDQAPPSVQLPSQQFS